MNELLADNIFYSCAAQQQRGHEQFVHEHTLGLIIAGETHLFVNDETIVCKEGTVGLMKRNQLLKSIKIPPANGEFKSISILLAQTMLRQYSNEYNIIADHKHPNILI